MACIRKSEDRCCTAARGPNASAFLSSLPESIPARGKTAMTTKNPIQCALWKSPEATVAKGLQAQFELLKTFVKESHWWRYLLKCRDCGQLYVYEFHEVLDYEGGEDPQFVTWVPVATEEEIQAAAKSPPGCMDMFVPRLRKDWPKGDDKPKLYWVETK
jgi:hypothetical protein